MTHIKSIIISLSVTIILSVVASLAHSADLKQSATSGKYIKETNNEIAEIEVKEISKGKVHVTGIAFWGTKNEYGPNIGKLDFTSSLRNGRIKYSEKGKYRLELVFKKKGLEVKENGFSDSLGMNVTFSGKYTKK